MPKRSERVQERADQFLHLMNAGYQALYRVESEAQWKAATDVKPEHDAGAEVAGRARAAFNGNPAVIAEAHALLEHGGVLSTAARLAQATEPGPEDWLGLR